MLLILGIILLIALINHLTGTKSAAEALHTQQLDKQLQEDAAFARRLANEMSGQKPTEPVYSTTNPLLKGIALSDPEMHNL